MMGDPADTSSNQLFSLYIENIAIKSTCMIIHIGNQLDYDVAVTIAYLNNESLAPLYVTGGGAKTPNPHQDQAT